MRHLSCFSLKRYIFILEFIIFKGTDLVYRHQIFRKRSLSDQQRQLMAGGYLNRLKRLKSLKRFECLNFIFYRWRALLSDPSEWQLTVYLAAALSNIQIYLNIIRTSFIYWLHMHQFLEATFY